jgi:acetyl esterase/lipase
MLTWQNAVTGLMRIVRPRHVDATSDIEDLRRQFTSHLNSFAPIPAGATFRPAQLGPIKGEWVEVEGAETHRLVLYFHGGGYIAGSPETHRSLVARLCQAGQARGFSLAYRLAPEFPFPAALRDCLDAYRFLLQKNTQPSSIVLAGDDAGGGLAFACLVAIRNAGLPMPAGCVAMSPWVDLSLSGCSMLANARSDTTLSWQLLFMNARQYLKKQSAADPYASPIYASFRDFPPLMVHAGSREILRDDASRIGEKAAEAGIPISVEIYDGMQHVFQATDVPEAKVSLLRLGQFIKSRASASMRTAAAQ